ncbi:MAG: hypothetical protein K0S44_1762 [Bacteroidetes bacterium]|jgi:hypothetical protein|nr:hypothetical protein [Bacteroidota bacterium]
MHKIFKVTLLLLLLIKPAFSQEETDSETAHAPLKTKGLNLGLYIGSYFANKYTAKLYDGYGFNMNGERNNFENSFMYQKIVMEYGGGYGQVDLVAQALGVQHGEWTFNESDMPVNMRYAPAFLIGLNGRYSVDAKNAILLNLNVAKLNVTGNFTIVTLPPTNSTQINTAIKTCAIKGTEQRLFLQLGYQRLLGESEKVNFILEGGLHMTLAKFDKNEILIGDGLLIDLTSYYYQPGYPAYQVRKPVGVGFGAFAGMGVNFNVNELCRIQLLYNPTYEGVNIGPDPKFKFQHALGIRIFYNF